jgi:formylglycine-generating enzyme required for sulfatase activity
MIEKKADSDESRIVPFSIAGIICFSIALLLGAGSWYLFGTNRRVSPEKNTIAVQTSNQNSILENSNIVNNTVPTPSIPTPESKKAPAGEVSVEGSEVTLGGEDSKLPLRRVAVESFAIGETEVTNAQYAEFLEETKHKAPNGWKDNKFPSGEAELPVVGVAWADANAYCEWLSKKLGATVRLPNEAEWELAARGSTDFKYPWGNAWNDEAAESRETKGKVRPVKSFPKGRSPAGAYEMVGNVWEWTGDLFVDEFGNPVLREQTKQRVIKGGSAQEERSKYLFIKARRGTPEDLKFELLGFRYVIIRK